LWIKGLVVFLSLALANGNAHAALHLSAVHSAPCPEGHAHHDGHTSSHHQHQSDKGFACCCDCLGCSSAASLPPVLSTTRAEFASQIRFDALTASFSSRATLPELHPPRPRTLS
jgi:hypothetical protein